MHVIPHSLFGVANDPCSVLCILPAVFFDLSFCFRALSVAVFVGEASNFIQVWLRGHLTSFLILTLSQYKFLQELSTAVQKILKRL